MRAPVQPSQIADEIIGLYERHGADDYIGEPVSQLEHMGQSAQLAEREGYDEEVILAAFLHDIGHLGVPTGETSPDGLPPGSMNGYGVVRHEKVGADYLRKKGFSEKIARLVENHVQAKRYLTFRHPEYYRQLSEASKQTLIHQGGPMTATEAEAFEGDELFEASIRMRQWDELAKEENVPTVDLRVYHEKCRAHLEKHLCF
ncbi:MAG: HD domain-containing protein [Ferruginibacter sp.]|nr:HD domain-containing protein [Cytophagales bacterium]